MFKLSVIVPAAGRQEDLDNTLLTVLENRPPACQVLVPHPATYRDPYDLSDEVRFVCSAADDLASLINAAVEASEAEVVHVLLSGTLAREGWTSAALQQFAAQPEIAAIAPAILDPDNERRLTAAGICYGRGGVKRIVARGKKLGAVAEKTPRVDGPLLQSMFIRREVLLRLGGLRTTFGDQHIDTDLAARLRAAEHTCVFQPACRVAGHLPKTPRGFHAARQAELLFWTHARRLRQPGALACHAWQMASDTLMQLPWPSSVTALLGRACGLPQGLSGWVPSHDLPVSATDDMISIPIEEGRRRMRTRSQIENHRQQYSRSA